MNFSVKSIGTNELLEKFKASNGDCRIIDVRTPLEYAQSHIPGSFNIPDHVLVRTPMLYLNKQYVYYIICKTGIRSYRVCEALSKQNYQVINIKGGIYDWRGPLDRDRCFN